jgi:hypothetical protein
MPTIDLRWLAVFRVGLSLVLVWDWLERWPHLEAFYTAAGTLPVEVAATGDARFPHPSLLALLDSTAAVRAAFLAGLVCYLLLGLGAWTRIACLASFVFLVSVLNRNITVRDGGDLVRLTLLLWSLLLPLGARLSVDRWRAGRAVAGNRGPHTHASAAAAAVLAQVGLIYLFAAIAKSGVTWRDGTAIHYALHVTEFATPLGVWLRQGPPALLRLLTTGTWLLELLAFALLLSPLGQPWLRRFAIVALGLLHLGIGLTMRLALFEATMVVSFILFLTAADWALLQRLRRRAAAPEPAPPTAQPPRPPPPPHDVRRWVRAAPGWAAAVLLVMLAVDGYNRNVARPGDGPPTLRRPHVVRAVVEVPQLIQDWHMFAPDPPRMNKHWVARAVSKDGTVVDPLTGGDPRAWLSRSNRLWYKYLSRLAEPRFEALRPHLARYLNARHNRSASEARQIGDVSLQVVREPIPAPGQPARAAKGVATISLRQS